MTGVVCFTQSYCSHQLLLVPLAINNCDWSSVFALGYGSCKLMEPLGITCVHMLAMTYVDLNTTKPAIYDTTYELCICVVDELAYHEIWFYKLYSFLTMVG